MTRPEPTGSARPPALPWTSVHGNREHTGSSGAPSRWFLRVAGAGYRHWAISSICPSGGAVGHGGPKKGVVAKSQSPGLAQGGLGSRAGPACRASASPSARQLDPCDPGNLAMPGQVLVAKERPVLPPMPTTPWVPLGTAGAQLSRGLSSTCPSHMPSSPVPRKSPKASTSAGSLEKLIQGRERRAWNPPPSLTSPDHHKDGGAERLLLPVQKAVRMSGELGHVWPRPRPC